MYILKIALAFAIISLDITGGAIGVSSGTVCTVVSLDVTGTNCQYNTYIKLNIIAIAAVSS